MQTAHRKAARAKDAQKHALFAPGSDLHPQEIARRKRRAAERTTKTIDAEWMTTWRPLEPAPPAPRRPGADDYLHAPGLVGTERVPYHVAPTTEHTHAAAAD